MQTVTLITFTLDGKTYTFGHVQVDGLTPNETVHIKTQENYADGDFGPGFDFPFGGMTDAQGAIDFLVPVICTDSTLDVTIFHDLVQFTAPLTPAEG